MRIHYLQHVPFENPAMLVTWAHERGHRLTGTHLYNFEAVPEPDQFDWLVIMGGPMNIYEEEQYPWLGYEKDCIRKAIEQDKVVLGICLGAQLIADVLGGKVTKNPVAEIGWLPVTLYKEKIQGKFFDGFPESFPVFQWQRHFQYARRGVGLHRLQRGLPSSSLYVPGSGFWFPVSSGKHGRQH